MRRALIELAGGKKAKPETIWKTACDLFPVSVAVFESQGASRGAEDAHRITALCQFLAKPRTLVESGGEVLVYPGTIARWAGRIGYAFARVVSRGHVENYETFLRFCAAKGLPEGDIVSIVERARRGKPEDRMPPADMTIKRGSGRPWQLHKLSASNPRMALAGHYTGSCMSYDGAGKAFVTAAMESPNAAMYVLQVRGEQWAAAAFAYRNNRDELVFDSIERSSNFEDQDDFILLAFKGLAQDCLRRYPDISRVLLGSNSNSLKAPGSLPLDTMTFADGPPVKELWFDSRSERWVLASRDGESPNGPGASSLGSC